MTQVVCPKVQPGGVAEGDLGRRVLVRVDNPPTSQPRWADGYIPGTIAAIAENGDVSVVLTCLDESELVFRAIEDGWRASYLHGSERPFSMFWDMRGS